MNNKKLDPREIDKNWFYSESDYLIRDINNLLLEWLPDDMAIGELGEISNKMFTIIARCYENLENSKNGASLQEKSTDA